jgi:hypothetical protein
MIYPGNGQKGIPALSHMGPQELFVVCLKVSLRRDFPF